MRPDVPRYAASERCFPLPVSLVRRPRGAARRGRQGHRSPAQADAPPPGLRAGRRCDMRMRQESLATGLRTRGTPKNSRAPRYVLVRGFVLRDDVGRNAAALIDLVSALLRPGPDLRAALAPGASARPAAPSRRTCFARVLHIAGQLFTELAGVAGTQVDLLQGAIESKRHGLCRLAPI